MNQQTEAAASTRGKTAPKAATQFAWLAPSLLICFLVAGCEVDTDLSEDSMSETSDGTDEGEPPVDEDYLPTDEGIPPIDNVTYEQIDVATFALG